MLISILIFTLIGIGVGIVTGLIPGIHPNSIVLSIPIMLSFGIEPLSLLSMVTAMAVVSVIMDYIPSILLGAPEEGNELSILPGHRMLMHGYGYSAIKLTVVGGVGAIITLTLFLPLIIFLLPIIYSVINPIIPFLLIAVVAVMIAMESGRKKILGLLCFVLAGIIGILSNKIPINNTLILFPMLSGLFGMSILLTQIKEKTSIPEQKKEEININNRDIGNSILTGSLFGIISGFLPGVGSSQMAVFSSLKKDEKSFLVSIGAITMANIVLSFFTIWLIGHARSGVAKSIEFVGINLNTSMIILAISLISVGVAAFLTLRIAKHFISFMKKINYSRLNLFVLIFLNVIIIIMTGPIGLLLSWLCCCLGLFSNFSGVRRSHMMGVLILPTILFYFGMTF